MQAKLKNRSFGLNTKINMIHKILNWAKMNKLTSLVVIFVSLWLFKKTYNKVCKVERFSSCYERKQIYLNSCDPDQPTGIADVNLEKRWGKLYIKIQANLPYVRGGVFHTMWGAYNAFLIDPITKKSINLGSLVRTGDHFYRLSNELLGDYSNYTRIDVFRQQEDYEPKRVLTGSIINQQLSSSF